MAENSSGKDAPSASPESTDADILLPRLGKSLEKEARRFRNRLTAAEQLKMVCSLEKLAVEPRHSRVALHAALEILRFYENMDAAALARRLVYRWSADYTLRYALANTLLLSSSRSDHLEAMKQRLIGCSRNVRQEMIKGAPPDVLRRLIEEHLGRVTEIEAFLDGKAPYPSRRILRIASHIRPAPPELVPLLTRLASLPELAMLPSLPGRNPGVTVVVDSNAFSAREFWPFLRDPRVRYVAPPDILLELARWENVQRVPWELDAVEIVDPGLEIPPEIESMYSTGKGAPPSLADKRVATLAWSLRASAIASDDKDLWDSGFMEQMARQYGYSVSVVSPGQFGKWLERSLAE